MEAYRTEADMAKHRAADPMPVLKRQLQRHGITQEYMAELEKEAAIIADTDFQKTIAAPEPEASTAQEHIFVPTPVLTESGERTPADAKKNSDGGRGPVCLAGNPGRRTQCGFIWTGYRQKTWRRIPRNSNTRCTVW